MQKWVAEAVQNLAPIGGAEKNGSDADAYAEAMQKVGTNCTNIVQNQTQINTDIADCRGSSVLICCIRPMRCLFAVCRKMAQMQKTGADDFAECRAEFRAVVGAELYAEKWY